MPTDTERIGGSPDVAIGLKLLHRHVSSHNFINQSTFSKATRRMLVVINREKEREGGKSHQQEIVPQKHSAEKNEQKRDSLIFSPLPPLRTDTSSKGSERFCIFSHPPPWPQVSYIRST